MKKIQTFMAMLIMGAVTFGFASCGDDDDETSNGDEIGNVDNDSNSGNGLDANSSHSQCPDENHPHAIDMGLPSGVKWTCCNVGASSPSEDGDYFAWGETAPKSTYDWDTYKWGGPVWDANEWRHILSFSKYTSNGKTTLESVDDAATQNWLDDFRMHYRMPTVDEFKELLNNTNYEWTEMYGVKGGKFTSKKTSASVFFPASGYRLLDFSHDDAGRYWSSTLSSCGDSIACDLIISFDAHVVDDIPDAYRYEGRSVRAVCP